MHEKDSKLEPVTLFKPKRRFQSALTAVQTQLRGHSAASCLESLVKAQARGSCCENRRLVLKALAGMCLSEISQIHCRCSCTCNFQAVHSYLLNHLIGLCPATCPSTALPCMECKTPGPYLSPSACSPLYSSITEMKHSKVTGRGISFTSWTKQLLTDVLQQN